MTTNISILFVEVAGALTKKLLLADVLLFTLLEFDDQLALGIKFVNNVDNFSKAAGI